MADSDTTQQVDVKKLSAESEASKRAEREASKQADTPSAKPFLTTAEWLSFIGVGWVLFKAFKPNHF